MTSAIRSGTTMRAKSKLDEFRVPDRGMSLDHATRGFARFGVDAHDHVGRATRREPAERHVGDVDLVLAENRADLAHHARLVEILEHEKFSLGGDFDLASVDAHD